MARDIVYFDLETQHTANDVGGWNRKQDMKMSVGVTYSTRTGAYRIFSEDKVEKLITQLQRADLVVGFNHINFDYAVLEGYTAWSLNEQLISLDLMVDVEQKIGHRLKLESLAKASLGVGKTGDGLDAIKWWRQGRKLDVAEYCCFDVKVTKMLHEFGVENKQVFYDDRRSQRQSVRVDWTL